MNTIQRITLSIAILGAVTGTISFFYTAWEKVKYRPRVAVKSFGVYDMAPNESRPAIYVVIEFQNMGKTKVTVNELPNLIVRLADGKTIKRYKLDPPKWDEPIYVELEPLEVKTTHYSGRELEDDIVSEKFPDIRLNPDNVRFELLGETTVGNYTAFTQGFRVLDQKTIDWLKKVGGMK